MRAKAILTTGWIGASWSTMASRTLPLMEAYCKRHGYAFMPSEFARYRANRPPSWKKIPAILDALRYMMPVVWLDTDVVVMPDAPPILGSVGGGLWDQAMVCHKVPEGQVPNCGVWIVRPEMAGELADLAMDDQYAHHPWWEQRALLDRMGFREVAGFWSNQVETTLFRGTRWLDPRFNVLHQFPGYQDPWFLHVSAYPMAERLAIVEEVTRGL